MSSTPVKQIRINYDMMDSSFIIESDNWLTIADTLKELSSSFEDAYLKFLEMKECKEASMNGNDTPKLRYQNSNLTIVE